LGGRRFTEGESFKDEYNVSGKKTLFQIVTSDGVFDYPISIDIQVDEFPF